MLDNSLMVTGRGFDAVSGGFIRAYTDEHRKRKIQSAHSNVITLC